MINYKLLDESINHWETLNFKRIESPWTVSQEVDNITKPPERLSFQLKHNDKCLVASGEQSFLYLYLKNFLPLGQFQTVTPCFRFEAFDFLHTKYFMKNEVIKTDIVSPSETWVIVQYALRFFGKHFDPKRLKTEETKEGWDIMLDGKYELGSYGIRECEFLKWIYGTALAEPRTSNLIKLYGVSS